jgi:hypothetical protein
LKLPESSDQVKVALAAGLLVPVFTNALGAGLFMPCGMVLVVIAAAWVKSRRKPPVIAPAV